MGRDNGGSTALATTVPSAPPAVKQALERSFDRLVAVLPKGGTLTPEKQIQVVSTLLFKTPDLQRCDPRTIVAAVLEASELGLSLSRSAGEAYLVPFNKECQFLPGYRGLVKLAYQSGGLALIQGRVVRPRDRFQWSYEPDLVFFHQPALTSEEQPATHAYAFAKLTNGERLVEVLTRAEVEKVRARSRAGRSGPWVTDWDEMAKKTALRRLCKILPRSEGLDRAIEADDRQFEAEVVTVPARAGASALAERLLREAGGAPPDEPAFVEGTDGQIKTEADDGVLAGAREAGEDG